MAVVTAKTRSQVIKIRLSFTYDKISLVFTDGNKYSCIIKRNGMTPIKRMVSSLRDRQCMVTRCLMGKWYVGCNTCSCRGATRTRRTGLLNFIVTRDRWYWSWSYFSVVTETQKGNSVAHWTEFGKMKPTRWRTKHSALKSDAIQWYEW